MILAPGRRSLVWPAVVLAGRDWEEDVLEPHLPRNTRRDQGPKQLAALLTHRASSPSSRRRSRKTPTFFAMSEASLAPRAPPSWSSLNLALKRRVTCPRRRRARHCERSCCRSGRKRTHSLLLRSGCRLQACRQRVAKHSTLHEENRSRSSRCRIFSLPKGLTRRSWKQSLQRNSTARHGRHRVERTITKKNTRERIVPKTSWWGQSGGGKH